MKNIHGHFLHKGLRAMWGFAFTARQNEQEGALNFFLPNDSNHSKSELCQEQMRPYPAAHNQREIYSSPYRKQDAPRRTFQFTHTTEWGRG